MKKNYLIFILVFSFALLFALPAFAYTYTRTPAGYNTYNPVNFIITTNTIQEIFPTGVVNSWKIMTNGGQGMFTIKSCMASTTLSVNKTITLPLADYYWIRAWAFSDEECFSESSETTLEGAFVVGEPPPPPDTRWVGTDFATSVFGFASETLFDLRVILYILVGLALGMGIILIILDLFEGRKQ